MSSDMKIEGPIKCKTGVLDGDLICKTGPHGMSLHDTLEQQQDKLRLCKGLSCVHISLTNPRQHSAGNTDHTWVSLNMGLRAVLPVNKRDRVV